MKLLKHLFRKLRNYIIIALVFILFLCLEKEETNNEEF